MVYCLNEHKHRADALHFASTDPRHVVKMDNFTLAS